MTTEWINGIIQQSRNIKKIEDKIEELEEVISIREIQQMCTSLEKIKVEVLDAIVKLLRKNLDAIVGAASS